MAQDTEDQESINAELEASAVEEDVSDDELDAIMQELETMKIDEDDVAAPTNKAAPAATQEEAPAPKDAAAEKKAEKPVEQVAEAVESAANSANETTAAKPTLVDTSAEEPKEISEPESAAVKKAAPAKEEVMAKVTPMPAKTVAPEGEQKLSMTVQGNMTLSLGFASGSSSLEIVCEGDAMVCRLANGMEIRVPISGEEAAKKSA